MEPILTVAEFERVAWTYLVLFSCDCSGFNTGWLHWAISLFVPLLCLGRLVRIYPGLQSAGLWLLAGFGGMGILFNACLAVRTTEAGVFPVGATVTLVTSSAVILTDLSLVNYCSGIVPANFLLPAVLSLGLVSSTGVAHFMLSTGCANHPVLMNLAVSLSLIVLLRNIARFETGAIWNPANHLMDEADVINRLQLIQAKLVGSYGVGDTR